MTEQNNAISRRRFLTGTATATIGNMTMLGWSYRLLRWGLGTVFIYSGATKLMAPTVFAVLIEAYGLVPDLLLLPVAIGLAAIELIAGFGLLLDIKGSLGMITGLLFLFVAILGYGIWMGLDVDCGCFGPEDPEAEAFHGLRSALLRDLAMLVIVVFLYEWRRRKGVRPITIIRNKRRKEDGERKLDAEDDTGTALGHGIDGSGPGPVRQ